MTTPWPCTTCNQPGVRNLGTEGYCARHLADLYRRFDPAVFALNGRGLPGHTLDCRDLQCPACDATWHGNPGDHCSWCAQTADTQLQHQAELALQPPDTDPDDVATDGRLDAWEQRLSVATQAAIITADEAHAAWNQAVNRAG